MSSILKRALIFISIVFFCLFISNFALANENNMMNSVKNGVNDVRNVVGGAENVVKNAATDTTTSIRDGMESMKNDTQSAMHDATSTRNSGDNFDATRTAANAPATNNTIWTWFIVAIITLIVIGVLWYMATRNNNSDN